MLASSSQKNTALNNASQLLVACLCADWCGACREYQPLFIRLQAEFPKVRFVWVDIEDQAHLVDPVEVNDFPTLLMAAGQNARFFGTITPHPDTLRRLILSLQDGSTSSTVAPEVQQLTTRLVNGWE
jgi:thiol-disulfide isomerase/thioredoxin